MPTKRKGAVAEDKRVASSLKKVKDMMARETAEHSEEVAHILEGYYQGLFKLLLLIAVKLDKMTDGLAEMIIRDSLNESDSRIEEMKIERKLPKQT